MDHTRCNQHNGDVVQDWRFGVSALFDRDDRSEILLHIGPHKTGTTGLQQAALRAKESLHAHGRIYLHDEGREQLNTSAVEFMRLSGDRIHAGAKRSLASTQLLRIVGAAPRGKLIISSEHLCRLDDAQVRALRDALTETSHGSSIKILVTLRPLAKIIPGQWQQFVRARPMPPLEEWVRLVLEENPKELHGRGFRQRHAHDALVKRWADVFGSDKITVIVADDQHPEFLYRSFEEVIGVPSGTLIMRRIANQSLTFEESELVRATHEAMQRAGMFGRQDSSEMLRADQSLAEVRHGEESQRLGWPFERIAKDLTLDRTLREGSRLELKGPVLHDIARWSHQIVEGIKKLQVHVMGDLDLLAPRHTEADLQPPTTREVSVSPRLAAALVVSALHAVGVGVHDVEPRVLRKVPTIVLVRQLAKRALPRWIRIRRAGRSR